MKKTGFRRILASLLSVSVLCSSAFTAFNVSADAGEKPPEVTEEERVFPDPDSFSYDDVEINFAKALQYVLYFYDANKCGYDVDEHGNPKDHKAHGKTGEEFAKRPGRDWFGTTGVKVTDRVGIDPHPKQW